MSRLRFLHHGHTICEGYTEGSLQVPLLPAGFLELVQTVKDHPKARIIHLPSSLMAQSCLLRLSAPGQGQGGHM